ncbi:MAG: Gfo/Idh/MocA family protein [Pirellulales bacterium]
MITAPVIVRSSSLGLAGTVAPSERISLGLIGCGNHGAGWNLNQIFRCSDVQVVALCDVDRNRLAKAQKKVDRHYSTIFGKEYRSCATHGDFRKLILRKDIDAVAVCTPDHWHIIPAIMAVRCGKDVICEKPLTLFVEEGKVLCRAVRDNKRVFQTASENRSIDVYRRLIELVRTGAIGRLRHIRVTLPGGNESRGANFNQRDEVPVPPEFNYDVWLGQAPRAPYVPARCHGSFRWFLDYSGGRLTDWGAHLIDLAQWGNDTEHTGPVEVEGAGKFPPPDSLFSTAYGFDIDYKYANGVTMNVSSQKPGIRFEGSDGWIESQGWRGVLKASRPEILDTPIDPEKVKLYRPSKIIARTDGGAGGEHRNFYDCVKSRRDCYAPAEIGHRTITISHLGNIAMLLGRKLKWDPEEEDFLGDAEATARLSRAQREPWTMDNIDQWISNRSPIRQGSR